MAAKKKAGFKPLSKAEQTKLRGGARKACCTVSTANSDCTKSNPTCTSNAAVMARKKR